MPNTKLIRRLRLRSTTRSSFILLAAFTVWFGYDGYLEDDPEMLEYLAFNRFGLRVTAYLTLVVGYQGWCELKERPVSPWGVPVIQGVFALWFAADGWLSQDPHNLQYAGFIQLAAVCWACAAAGFGLSAAMERREPVILLPLLVLGLSGAFAFLASGESDVRVAYYSASFGLLCVAIWLAMRKFRERRAAAR